MKVYGGQLLHGHGTKLPDNSAVGIDVRGCGQEVKVLASYLVLDKLYSEGAHGSCFRYWSAWRCQRAQQNASDSTKAKTNYDSFGGDGTGILTDCATDYQRNTEGSC